jgi:hypothetical protein
MQITESERLLILEKKEEICRLTLEILDIVHQPRTDSDDIIEVKKRMIRILALLSSLASYGFPGRDLDAVMKLVLRFFSMQGRAKDDFLQGIPLCELFCITANSIDYTSGWLPPLIRSPVPPHDILVRK